MNKKGDVNWEELIKAILFATVFLLFLLPLGVYLYNYFVPSVDKELKTSLNMIVDEAKDLKKELEDMKVGEKVDITIPIDIPGGTLVMATNKSTEIAPSAKCTDFTCICIKQIKDKKVLSSCEILKGIEIDLTSLGVIIEQEGEMRKISTIKIQATKQEDKTVITLTPLS